MLCPFCIITVALLSLLRCHSAFGPRRLGGVIPSDNGHQTLIVYNEESKALSAQVGTVERCVVWQRCQQQKSVEHTLHRLTSFMCVCERLHVCLHSRHVYSLQRPEKSLGSPGTGVTSRWFGAAVCMLGTGPGSSDDQPGLDTAEPSHRPHFITPNSSLSDTREGMACTTARHSQTRLCFLSVVLNYAQFFPREHLAMPGGTLDGCN